MVVEIWVGEVYTEKGFHLQGAALFSKPDFSSLVVFRLEKFQLFMQQAVKGENFMHNHHSIYCILPPHILTKIVENGTATQQEKARQTIVTTEQMRGKRRAMKSMTALSIATLSIPVAGIANKLRTIYDAKNGSTLPGNVVRNEVSPLLLM